MRVLSVLAAATAIIIIVFAGIFCFTDSEKEPVAHSSPEQAEESPVLMAYFNSNIEMHEAFPTDARIVFIGDSRIDHPDWEDMFENVRVGNRGISGDTFHSLLKRIEHLGIRKPDVALLEIGVNDVLLGYELDAIRANADAVMAKLLPMVGRLVVLEVIDCKLEGCDRPKVAAVNAYLRDLAARNGAQFVELNPRLADAEGLRMDLSQDGVHLNAAGYRQVVEILCEQVSELSCKPAAQ